MNFEQKASLFLGGADSRRKELFFSLLDVGRRLTFGSTSEPLTYIVNVPRIEYAALLIAAGIVIQWSCVPEDVGWEKELNAWLGKKVSFRPKGKVNPGTAWSGILIHSGSGPGSKIIFGTEKYGEYEIDYNDLENVKLDEGIQETTVRSGIKKHIRQKIKAVLGVEGVDNLNSKISRISILGTKNRILDEMEEIIPFFAESECKFSEFLKPDNPDSESVRTLVCSSKDDVSSTAEEIVIIEGSRRISDILDQTKFSNRVFIIAANEVHYTEACQAINGGFTGFKKEFIINDFITIFHY